MTTGRGGSRTAQAHDLQFARESVACAADAVGRGDQPFGAVVAVGANRLVASCNEVLATHDPTAHAEIVAIRAAVNVRAKHQLDDCTLYASCEPCVMCAGAIAWSGIRRVFFCLPREIAERYGFPDVLPRQISRAATAAIEIIQVAELASDACAPFDDWARLYSGKAQSVPLDPEDKGRTVRRW
ncbi:nucleoside deaminase [Streptomyces sp. NPDC056470]|uniref:nucleoside deaminase n=1 Tax=Streptomyces sp. NPDC056470 TaxID=3345831 RepID=UPI00367D1373